MVIFMVYCDKMASYSSALQRTFVTTTVKNGEICEVVRTCNPVSSGYYGEIPQIIITPPLPSPPRARLQRVPRYICPDNARTRALREYNEAALLGRIASRSNVSSDKFSLYLGKNKYSPRALLKLAASRRVYAETSHKTVWENCDIPKGVAQPTSCRQIKKRSPSVTFSHDMLVDEHIPQAPLPIRSSSLLHKLQVNILQKRCREMPTTTKCRALARILKSKRVARFTRKVIRYARCHCNLCRMRNLLLRGTRTTAEGEGWRNMFKPTVEHKIEPDTQNFLEGAIENIKATLSDKVDSTGKKIADSLASVGGILLTAATANNKVSWTVGILSSFVVVGVLNTHKMAEITSYLTGDSQKPESTRATVTGNAQAGVQPSISEQHEFHQTDNISRGLTLLFQTIGTYCGIMDDNSKKSPAGMKDWACIFTKNFQQASRSHIGMLSFFRNFVEVVKQMLKYIYFKLNPGAESIIAFWEHSAVCRAIVIQVDGVLTTPLFHFASTENMAMLESCIILVTEIVIRIGTVDGNTASGTLLSYFMKLKSDLISLKQKCAQNGYSAVARATPYAIAIAGDRGIGKSNVLNEIASELSETCGVTSNVAGKVYSKRLGSKFYDGHTNEEIILFDDFCQIQSTTPDDSDAQDIFQIITDQPFRPNMAVAEEKGKIVDVKLVLMAMNNAFPKVNFLSDQQALWRRRNVLVHMRPKGAMPGNNSVYDKTFNHVEFGIYPSTVDQNSKPTTYMTLEKLITYLKKDAEDYKLAQESKVKARIDRTLQNNTASFKDRKQPLSVEALQNALKEALMVTSTDSIWDKYCKAAYDNKVVSWMKNKLSFLYETPKDDEVQKEIEKSLDAAYEDNAQDAALIDEHNYRDYLSHHNIWKGLKPKQQKTVEDFWNKQFPDTPFQAPIQMGEGENPPPIFESVDPTPCLSKTYTETRDAFVVKNMNHHLPTSSPYAKTEQTLQPLSYYLVKCNLAMGKPMSDIYVDEAIKYIESKSKTCRHTLAGLHQYYHLQHCAITDNSTAFPYYNCAKIEGKRSECILSSKTMMNVYQLLSPELYRDMIAFSKCYKDFETLKIQSWQIPPLPLCKLKLITKWCRETFQKYKPKLTTAFKWLWKFLKWVLMLLAPIAIIVGVIFSYKGWTHAKDEEDTSVVKTVKNLPPHFSRQYDQLVSTRGRSVFSPYQGFTDAEATYTIVPRQPSGNVITRTHISGAESQCEKDMFKIFKKATTFIYASGRNKTTGELTTMNLRVFRIGGKYLLLPKHYITFLGTLDVETLSLSMVINNTTYRLNIGAFKYLDCTGSEMMVLVYDSLPRSKDIRTHFATQEIWEAAPVPNHMRILEVASDGSMNIFEVNPRIVRDFGITCYNEVMATYGEVLHYKWAGEGRCMSIVIDDNLKIRGFHIAGDHKSSGYAAIVTKDLVMELGSIIDPPSVPYIDHEDVPKVVLDGIVHTVGKVQAKYEVHLPTKTAIRESEIHGVFPVRTVPAPLVPCSLNEHSDPLLEGIKKHGMPSLDFDAGDVAVVRQRFREMLLTNVKPIWDNIGVRSMDVAIRGVESTPGFKSLVLSTSEGFPFMCERKGQSSKRWLIHQHISDSGSISYSVHSRLQEEYDKNMSLRKQGIVPPTVNVDCLKDARLPVEKAYLPGKVRIFSVAPTDFVIAFRQYFADFIVSFTHAKFNFFHALGIAPETSEWTDMVNHMTEVGNKFLTGDYSNFGPGFNNTVFKEILEARLQWYETHSSTVDAGQFQEDQLVRNILNIETSEPIHLAKDLLYQTMSGMCSGSPSTTIDNCCVNIFYIMLAYYVIMSKHDPKLATLDAMYKHLRLLVFGDDVFMCVSDTICEVFNNLTLHKFFKSYNIKYTDADKTGEMRKYCSLKEASFLKRSFIQHPYNRMQVMGAVEKRSIEDCANWITKTVDIRSASVEATYAALQLAYGWGPDYFNQVRRALWDAWFKKGIRVTLRSWLDYDLMYNKRDFPLHLCAEAEGPPTSTPGEQTSCDESKDTIIQEHAVPDTDCPKLSSTSIADWAGADYDASYERLVNRYVLLDNFDWSTSMNNDEYLTKTVDKKNIDSKWTLPLALLVKNVNTPTILPFLQHKYANFDMTIKVIVNANKFMVGQLLVAWYYLHEEDASFSKFRDSIYSKSQMLHTVIDAGSSNSVEMCVPYKNFRPYLHLLVDDNLGTNASLGQLSIKVMSQLSVTSSSYKSATVSVYVKFNNATFMGVMPRDLGKFSAEGEMLPMLTTMAAAYLMQKNADGNRDKPPVQLPPTHMTPQATTSLAIGTGCSEPLAALRLDARGQVPHPDSGDSEMDLITISQKPALLTRFSWKDGDSVGTIVWKQQVTPTIPLETMQSKSIFTDPTTKTSVYGYAVPPVSVIAGLMTYWRGSLVYDFSVVASQYHTGRLLICFCPEVLDSITLTQAQALPYVVYDIHDERTFSFTTPYIADKPWWPCGYINGQKEETKGIGTIFVMVLNELIPMDQIPNTIDILVYFRAHSSFEVSIPRQSVWALPWTLNVNLPQDIRARDGYAPWFISTWRFINSGNTSCLRYGEVTDHVAEFSNMVAGAAGTAGGWYYYTLDPLDPDYAINSKLKFKSYTFDQIAFVPIDVNDGYGLIYLYCIALDQIKDGVFPDFYPGKTKGKSDPSKGLKTQEESGYVTSNPLLKRNLYPNTQLNLTLSDLEAESEIEVCEPSPIVKSTENGMLLFGESYNDLKDYSRRYEPLFRVLIPERSIENAYFGFAFDACPAGNSISSVVPFSRFSRDGGHAIMASCFRFYRGSMNYKFISNTLCTNLWVEHRPDRSFLSSDIRRTADSVWDGQLMKNYAQVYNPSTVNRVITVNVPFYQPGSCGLLQAPSSSASEFAKRAYSLGEIILHLQVDTIQTSGKVNTIIDVLRAIGDDMRYYNYTGFPMLINIEQYIKSGFL